LFVFVIGGFTLPTAALHPDRGGSRRRKRRFLIGVLTDAGQGKISLGCAGDPHRRGLTVLIDALIFGYFLTVTQLRKVTNAHRSPSATDPRSSWCCIGAGCLGCDA